MVLVCEQHLMIICFDICPLTPILFMLLNNTALGFSYIVFSRIKNETCRYVCFLLFLLSLLSISLFSLGGPAVMEL